MQNKINIRVGKMLPMILILFISANIFAKAPWENGKLKVSPNGRFLQHENGTPFFWQGDTAWLLVQKLNREQIENYFADRKKKGFNVVQCIVLQFYEHKTPYGDAPFIGADMTKEYSTPGNNPNNAEQYDFWDHLDFAVETAAKNDIYLAVTPLWGAFVKRNPVKADDVKIFAANLANRLKDKKNIIWLNGGSGQGDIKPEVWDAIGTTVKRIAPNQLMTFHTFGRTQSSTWYHNASWLDFNMFTSGHRRYDQDDTPRKWGEDNWRYVLDDLAKSPRKPTIDGEPSYEALPQGIHDHSQPIWQPEDVRRYAYWSVFAGAFGHVYGHHSIRQVYAKGGQPEGGAKMTMEEAYNAPGGSQMQHLKRLILSRPYFDRINDQSVISGNDGEKYEKILVTRGKDYLFAYNYTGRDFSLKMGAISGKKLNGWWFDPRTGEAKKLGNFANQGVVSFNPPGETKNGNDWVLVLDDAAKKFKTPGK
ncbi:MAG TPA: glycoside hydrolase family 140 protein [Pyrinomonadaceae bacterium]|nr:glycoside hydrolase family 140 protein [Pyrinomonadaceae bacterium]